MRYNTFSLSIKNILTLRVIYTTLVDNIEKNIITGDDIIGKIDKAPFDANTIIYGCIAVIIIYNAVCPIEIIKRKKIENHPILIGVKDKINCIKIIIYTLLLLFCKNVDDVF